MLYLHRYLKAVIMVNIRTLKHYQKLAHSSNEIKQYVKNAIVKFH